MATVVNVAGGSVVCCFSVDNYIRFIFLVTCRYGKHKLIHNHFQIERNYIAVKQLLHGIKNCEKQTSNISSQ